MTHSNSPAQAIISAKTLIESDRRSEIRLKANGGNSVLIVCDPMAETAYISQMKELLPAETYSFIDLNQSLIDFVIRHKEDITGLFDNLQSSIHEIFKAPAGEESDDLFKTIIRQIQQALDNNKVPVLINTGALYGSGIDNIHLMESKTVMSANLPLMILYPATKENDTLMFLGSRPSSKYRCAIIQ